jgi:hypothetical protein
VGLKISVKLPQKTYASHTSHDIHLSKQRSPSFKATISISQSKVSLFPSLLFDLYFLGYFILSVFLGFFFSFFVLSQFFFILSQFFSFSSLSEVFFFFFFFFFFFSLSQFLFSFSGFFCYSFQLGDSLVDYWCVC